MSEKADIAKAGITIYKKMPTSNDHSLLIKAAQKDI